MTGPVHSLPSLRPAWLLAGLVALLPARPAAADFDRLVRKAETAETRVSYEGVKSIRRFERRGHDEERVVRVQHRAPDNTRIESMGGRGASVILRLGDRMYWCGPGRLPRGPGRERAVERLDLLLQNYSVRKLRSESVAGHGTLVLSIEPRHPGNPKKVIWVEPRSGLILKTQLFNSAGEITEESAFREVNLSPVFASSLFALSPDCKPLQEPPPLQPDFEPKRPAYVPPGYLLVRTTAFREREGRLVAYMKYTDGLNTLSLFQTRSRPGESDRWFGFARARGTVGDLRFAILGDTSREELNRMAESLRE